ncbi:hypothetical protein LshimejAT787_0602600 [Lyophyllum shimeji]|uniref:Uncharacterized protein n=1 Tax=Lyophyllum shimeji TaxID=47721 RepID=A0A9P3UMY1_LYOSH|nr:hypothetical protein LshimejAT787_0602600 [Lyophyllum shimeji]
MPLVLSVVSEGEDPSCTTQIYDRNHTPTTLLKLPKICSGMHPSYLVVASRRDLVYIAHFISQDPGGWLDKFTHTEAITQTAPLLFVSTNI